MHEILDDILPRVSKPARYTGGEFNAIIKDHESTDVKFALAFPDTYEIGMSNLGLRILYHILNKREDTLAERVFTPWTDMEEEMRQHGLSLFGLESKTPVKDFDILGFSLGYELTYSNVLNMLDLSGIPVLSSERTEDHPLVIAGGCCTFNPEPLADFMDAFVIGEGEEVVNDVVDMYKLHRNDGRETLLRKLAQIEGVYIPSLYQVSYNPDGTVKEVAPKEDGIPAVVTKRFVKNIDSAEYPETPVMPFIDTVHDRIPLEIMRGCSRGCRFCQAGIIYRPVRQRSPEKLKDLAEVLSANTGYDEIALLSLSSSDYRGIEDLVKDLIVKYEDQRIGLSLPSIRADARYIDLASEIQKVRKSGLTLAPEAGTQRLRDVIDKNVTEEDLIGAVEAAYRYGWKRVKLYFMIGLPTETDEDIEGIASLASNVAHAGRKMGIRPTVGVSVSSFVPKPHTPFQWHAQDSIEEIERKQNILKRSIRDKCVSLSWHDSRTSRLEAILSRGDRRLGAAILRAWQDGCRFDAWHEFFNYDKWMSALASAGLDPEFYANRKREYTEVLPWDHISCGVNKQFLIREDKRAETGETTPDCRSEDGKCTGCGVSRLIPVSADGDEEVTDVPCITKA
ncbi:MAG: TIGR03960 family B12-binding radical SAM protein [Armatimonadota bacterium]